MRLYEYPEAIRAVIEDVDPETGEIAVEQEQRLAELELGMEDKVRAYGAVIREQEAEAGAIKEEIARLRRKQRARENTAAWLKSQVLGALREMGVTRIDHPVLPIRRQKSPPSARCGDEIPEAWKKVKTVESFDARGFLAAHETPDEPGEYEIDGVLVVVGEHVRIG